MKKLIRDAAIYLGLSLGCMIGADHVVGVWHDALLLMAGVCLGGVAFMVVMIKACLAVRGEDRAR